MRARLYCIREVDPGVGDEPEHVNAPFVSTVYVGLYVYVVEVMGSRTESSCALE